MQLHTISSSNKKSKKRADGKAAVDAKPQVAPVVDKKEEIPPAVAEKTVDTSLGKEYNENK